MAGNYKAGGPGADRQDLRPATTVDSESSGAGEAAQDWAGAAAAAPSSAGASAAAATPDSAGADSVVADSVVADYLRRHEEKTLLRFITCGSVDDGKSTLIGRLLHDSKKVFEDQLAALRKDSSRFGTTGGEIDFALLTDGLKAEREQGITIDVAYRYFSTDRRTFIIADSPGHEEYTRNMVTGASGSDLAVLLVDASAGVKTQTRRHAILTSLLGIRNVVLAVNKMDKIGYDRQRFAAIETEFRRFMENLPEAEIVCIPMSALEGHNVTGNLGKTPWYQGPTFLEHLETVEPRPRTQTRQLRFPVQYVLRPNQSFRGYAGTLRAGSVGPGDLVRVLPSGRTGQVASVLHASSGDPDLRAQPGEAIVITLENDLDLSRGDLVVDLESDLQPVRRFRADLVWFLPEGWRKDRAYEIKAAYSHSPVRITEVQGILDINNLGQIPGDGLEMNQIGSIVLELEHPLLLEPYDISAHGGNFILIDRITRNTAAAGMVRELLETGPEHSARRSGPVSSGEREKRLGQKAALVAVPGDIELADAERELHELGFHVLAWRHGPQHPASGEAIRALLEAGTIVLVGGRDWAGDIDKLSLPTQDYRRLAAAGGGFTWTI